MTSNDLCKLIALNINIGFSKYSLDTTSILLKQKFEGGEYVLAIPFLKYGNIFNIRRRFYAYIVHDQVENILKKVYFKNGIEDNAYTVQTILEMPAMVELVNIGEPDSIESVIPLLRNEIESIAIPFFTQYKNINNIIAKIDSLDKNELHSFVYKPHLIRILILLKITNSPKYYSYKEEVNLIYRTESTGKYAISFMPLYRMLPDLLDQLDQI